MAYIHHPYKKPKQCVVCNRNFEAKTPNQKYCSEDCQIQVHRTLGGEFNSNNSISCGTVGAISELLASVDLMKRGYEVHRALSPQSNCDVLAIKNKKVYRFEIRTARKVFDGKLNYSLAYIKAPNVIAVVIKNSEIYYFPSNPISES